MGSSVALKAIAQLWVLVQLWLWKMFFHDHPPEQHQDVTHVHEVKLSLIFVIFFYLLRNYAFGKLMVARLGAYVGVMVDTIALKLINQSISLIMHIFSTIWAVVYLPHEEWFLDLLAGKNSVLFENIVTGGDIEMSLPFKVFYNVHLGYQLHALHFTIREGSLFCQDRRADYRQMLAHHIIAVTLIFLSYIMGYFRIGVLVMISHNISDIAVCITKSVKLLGWTRGSLFLLPFMIITWLITRLVFYPFYVLAAVMSIPFHKLSLFHAIPVLGCCCGLFFLLLLNIFWFVKFLQMAGNAVLFGNAADITESRRTNSISDKYGVWNKQKWWQIGG